MMQSVCREVTIETEVSHLAAGMDSCIGATGTVNPNILSQEVGQGFLNDLLYCPSIALALPTGVATTPIGEYKDVGHRRFHSIKAAKGSQIRP